MNSAFSKQKIIETKELFVYGCTHPESSVGICTDEFKCSRMFIHICTEGSGNVCHVGVKHLVHF